MLSSRVYKSGRRSNKGGGGIRCERLMASFRAVVRACPHRFKVWRITTATDGVRTTVDDTGGIDWGTVAKIFGTKWPRHTDIP
eukprot:10048850-Alexandrium_andersonii.AAC.1